MSPGLKAVTITLRLHNPYRSRILMNLAVLAAILGAHGLAESLANRALDYIRFQIGCGPWMSLSSDSSWRARAKDGFLC